jgi:hypothetical protein
MEIVKNIKHQEADIRSIIADTRVVQKEIQVYISSPIADTRAIQ